MAYGYEPQQPQDHGLGTGAVILTAFAVSLLVATGVYFGAEALRGRLDTPVGGEVEGGVKGAPTAITVPDLDGLTVEDARKLTDREYLLLRIEGPRPAGAIDQARVTTQSPLPGSTLRPDGAVVVRLGAEAVAQATKDADLKAAPEPTAVAAAPAPTAPVVPVATARVPANALVPQVTGMTVVEASQVLASAQLMLGDVQKKTSPKTEGKIVSQAPAPGTAVTPGTAIAIAVSTGPATIRIPRLARRYPDDARAKLKALGFRTLVSEQFHPNIPTGLVSHTTPRAGTEAEPGSLVRIYVVE